MVSCLLFIAFRYVSYATKFTAHACNAASAPHTTMPCVHQEQDIVWRLVDSGSCYLVIFIVILNLVPYVAHSDTLQLHCSEKNGRQTTKMISYCAYHRSVMTLCWRLFLAFQILFHIGFNFHNYTGPN